ncbi:Protein extra-macrochaetae [Pseudolycoriella hygida]|uniref:Protein extra-macrochaetae n=1 Tax=Pseudolycoriella hygida TaxID=35572 RepID=A0A9Q0RTB0_9DIPT|nr:Protein extra-macrochaetae [Pseudolycoriella hygida]
MKAITVVCATGASVPTIHSGRIARRRGSENAEIQMYLSKLKDLVPHMPKNKKLSKLEVIENAIEYIYDLETALRTTSSPSTCKFDSSALLSESMSSRRPLGVRSSPNNVIAASLESSTVTPTNFK